MTGPGEFSGVLLENRIKAERGGIGGTLPGVAEHLITHR